MTPIKKIEWQRTDIAAEHSKTTYYIWETPCGVRPYRDKIADENGNPPPLGDLREVRTKLGRPC